MGVQIQIKFVNEQVMKLQDFQWQIIFSHEQIIHDLQIEIKENQVCQWKTINIHGFSSMIKNN